MVSYKKTNKQVEIFLYNFIKETQMSSRQSKAESYHLLLLLHIYSFHELLAFERNVAKIKIISHLFLLWCINVSFVFLVEERQSEQLPCLAAEGSFFKRISYSQSAGAWPISRDTDPTGSLSWERIWFPLRFYGTECVPSPVNTTCFPQTRIPFLTSHFMPHHSNTQIRAILWYTCCHSELSPPALPRWTRAPCLVFMLCCCCLE